MDSRFSLSRSVNREPFHCTTFWGALVFGTAPYHYGKTWKAQAFPEFLSLWMYFFVFMDLQPVSIHFSMVSRLELFRNGFPWNVSTLHFLFRTGASMSHVNIRQLSSRQRKTHEFLVLQSISRRLSCNGIKKTLFNSIPESGSQQWIDWLTSSNLQRAYVLKLQRVFGRNRSFLYKFHDGLACAASRCTCLRTIYCTNDKNQGSFWFSRDELPRVSSMRFHFRKQNCSFHENTL